jgi:quercetin dioxygenase-like cupin family protein
MSHRTLFAICVAVASLAPRLAGQAPAGCNPSGGVQFICGQEAPEDLAVVPGSQWVFASVMAGGGGIRVINVRDMTTSVVYPTATSRDQLDARTYDSCPGAPDAADKAAFRTHGLALRPGRNSTHTLYAVHHGKRESIEVFQVDARATPPALTWIGCAVVPDPIGLNSIVPLPDGGFVATDFLARGIDAAGRGKMMAGEPNGGLWDWHTRKGWTKVAGSDTAGANGLELSKDGKWFYVAAWGSQSFVRMSRGQTPVKKDVVPLGFRVDNLRWAPDGSIIAAGQGGTAPSQTTNVVKIDPNTLKVQEIIRHQSGPEFGPGTVAVQIEKEIWVGSFRGDRIARFPAAGLGAQQSGFKRTVIQQEKLSVPGREAVTAVVEFQPGATVGRHTHPGEEIGYILEGTLVFEIEGKPTVTLSAGQTFFIPSGTVHNATNKSSSPAKVLANYVVEPGKPLATPVK